VEEKPIATTWSDPISMSYHVKQWDDEKRSTHFFGEFCKEEFSKSISVLDLGCGTGAATYQLARKNPHINFIGVDSDEVLIKEARQRTEVDSVKNLSFMKADWFDLPQDLSGFDGVISLQTLSWLSEMERPMAEVLSKVRPKWMAISSLFYEGDVTCEIRVTEHTRSRSTNYNVYSIPAISRLVHEFGYDVSRSEDFEIDIDLPRPQNPDLLGTYTERLLTGAKKSRLQISGPLLMPWKFILVSAT
jgi:SAM-dependent methyltransferase